jgi:hypothetical protein
MKRQLQISYTSIILQDMYSISNSINHYKCSLLTKRQSNSCHTTPVPNDVDKDILHLFLIDLN